MIANVKRVIQCKLHVNASHSQQKRGNKFFFHQIKVDEQIVGIVIVNEKCEFSRLFVVVASEQDNFI